MRLRLARKVLYRWHRARRGPLPLDRRSTTELAAIRRWSTHFRRWRRDQPGPIEIVPSGRPRRASFTQQVTLR